MTDEEEKQMESEREKKHLQCGEKLLKFSKSIVIYAFILLSLLTVAAAVYYFCYRSNYISAFHIIIHSIIVLIIIVICITYISYVAITYFIFKKRIKTQNENINALNEAYDKIFGQDYSCEYKCWEKYNENPNYHYKLEKKTYKSRKPNNTQNIPTENSNNKTAQKTPDKGAKMKTPTDITKGETKGENSTATKEN